METEKKEKPKDKEVLTMSRLWRQLRQLPTPEARHRVAKWLLERAAAEDAGQEAKF